VILGVTQMMFGLCLSLSNALFFKDYAAVWLEFVPQVIFLMCTFGKPTGPHFSLLAHNPPINLTCPQLKNN
jgi:V-type H+-transporting ATPase subunit a